MSSTGVKHPTANTTIVAGWTNPNNAHTSNDIYTDCLAASEGAKQDYRVFSGLYAAIPAGAIINGISATVKGFVDGIIILNGDRCEVELLISVNGGASYSAPKTWSFSPDDPEMTIPYGGSSDNWGLTLTKESFSDANFRLQLHAASFVGGASDMNVDTVTIDVDYTPSAVPNGLMLLGVGS